MRNWFMAQLQPQPAPLPYPPTPVGPTYPAYPQPPSLYTSTNVFDQFTTYLQGVQVAVVDFLLRLVVAFIFVVIGYIIAWVIEWVIRWLVDTLKINEFLKNVGLSRWLEKGDVEVKTEHFLGKVAFWIVWILFWMPALDLLHLSTFNDFLRQLFGYLPTAVAGGLIFVASIFLAEFLKRVVRSVLKSSEVVGAGLGGQITYWAIVVFGIAATLSHLGVARDIINILVTGVVGFLILAGGLAFGLGGQEAARDFINKIKQEMHR